MDTVTLSPEDISSAGRPYIVESSIRHRWRASSNPASLLKLTWSIKIFSLNHRKTPVAHRAGGKSMTHSNSHPLRQTATVMPSNIETNVE
jgi:hypothetical protein